MKKVYLYFLLILVASACSVADSPKEEFNNSEELNNMGESLKITPEQAIQNALSYMEEIYPETRSLKRGDCVVTSLRRKITRSLQSNQEYPDTMYYIINFSNDNGFVIMGADRRLPKLLAISDTGNMNIEDTTYNRGLASFMKSYLTPYLPVDPIPDTVQSIKIIGLPMLSTAVRKWGQRAPYNDLCPVDSSGVRAATGCGPLAVAQVMTFFEYPSSYGSINFDWKKMKKGEDNKTVAELIRALGDETNLAANYFDDGGTSIINSNLPRAFRNFDYEVTYGFKSLNREFPYDLLFKHNPEAHPLLFFGKGYVINADGSHGKEVAHIWVADGGMILGESDSPYRQLFIHCVWGYSGANNGYYLYTYDGKIGGKPDELAPGDQKYDFEGFDYEKNLSGWYEYKPKNK